MKLEEFSVKYPLFVNLLSVFIILAGLLSLKQMNREAFPNFSFDIVQVSTLLSGASPAEIEKLVTQPIEEKIAEVNDIEKYESFSVEGRSQVVITIDPDTDNKDRVVNDIQRAVDRVEDLPDEIEDRPLVFEIQTKTTPIVEVHINGDVPYPDLRRYAKNLEDRLLDIPDVSSVAKLGYREKEMSVEVNPALLDRHHIALTEVMDALRKQNRNVPGGKVLRGDQEYIVRTVGEFYTPEEIEQTVIRANDLGNVIKVGDIATVKETYEEELVLYRTNGENTINLVVIKKEKGDAIDLVERVKQVTLEYKKELPEAVEIELINDFSFWIKRRLGILSNNAYIGIVLVIASLLVFLSRSVALTTALGLPVAGFSAFFFMNIMGISVNLISMFGLIIVLGILVDDSIIVAENIYHHLEQGKSAHDAAIDGLREVFWPVTATILTTIAAFTPLLFMSGIFGKFVSVIPKVVIIALIASFIEAIFILPSHVAEAAHFGKWWAKDRAKKVKSDWLEPLAVRYERMLRKWLKFRYAIFVVVPIVITLTGALYYFKMDFILFSAKGIEIFFLRAEAEVGTPLEKTADLMVPLEKLIEEIPDDILDDYITQVGIVQNDPNDPFTSRGSHMGQIVVFLSPAQKREVTADEVIDNLRGRLKPIQEQQGFSRVWFDRVRPGPPVGKPVAIRVRGEDFEVLNQIARKVEEQLKTIEGVVDIRSDYELGKKEFVYKIIPDLVGTALLSVEEVAANLQIAYDGGVATIIKTAEEEIDVVVRFPFEAREDPNSIRNLYVRNRNDVLVPLWKITNVSQDQGVSVIKHLDRKRVVSVTASVQEKVITSAKVNSLMKEKMAPLMKDYLDYTILYSGEQEDTEKSLQDLQHAALLAMVMIFLILATNLGSVTQPLIVMTSIPLSLIGVVIAFFLNNEPLGFMALIGCVGLAGIVVNDAIVLVHAINKYRHQGMDVFEAVVRGGRRRLRPVLLTTFTTVLGLLPVAYGIGGKDPFLVPMALAISWGLLFATTLTLIVVPTFYMILNDWHQAARKISESVCHRSIENGYKH